jgi:hypothetical protein
LSRGGDQEALVPGTSLGRVPRTIASDPLEWVPYRPQQATPGQPNPQPGVEILLPMDGAIVTADPGDLTWYPVAGAARYRVQLAAEPSFATPLVDQTVEQPPVRTPALSPGSYVCRARSRYAPPGAPRAADGRCSIGCCPLSMHPQRSNRALTTTCPPYWTYR